MRAGAKGVTGGWIWGREGADRSRICRRRRVLPHEVLRLVQMNAPRVDLGCDGRCDLWRGVR